MFRTAADIADPHPLAPVELIAGEVRVGAFSPHRHETYTIAATTSGVQSFNYRGDRRRSLPGQLLVLHPDELHDGYCSDAAGFSYRAIYLPPAQVQGVIGGVPLPFLAGGVSSDPELVGSALHLMATCATAADAFAYQDALHGLVYAMQRSAGAAPSRRTPNRAAVTKVRDFLDTLPGPGTGFVALVSGPTDRIDTWWAEGFGTLTQDWPGITVAVSMADADALGMLGKVDKAPVTAPAGWTCEWFLSDDKAACTSTDGGVAGLVIRDAADHDEWLSSPDKGADPGVYVTDVHDGIFISVEGGQGTTDAEVTTLGEGLAWVD